MHTQIGSSEWITRHLVLSPHSSDGMVLMIAFDLLLSYRVRCGACGSVAAVTGLGVKAVTPCYGQRVAIMAMLRT